MKLVRWNFAAGSLLRGSFLWGNLLVAAGVVGCKATPSSSAQQPEPASLVAQAPLSDAEPAPNENPPERSQLGDNASLLLGNPSDARNSATTSADNLLVVRPQHALSYNATLGGPNWVSWHTQSSDLGPIRRGTFRPDPLLPVALQIRPNDYRGSGYDRGHVCPSGDRTSTRENNDATFVMSNMLPQAPALNQQVWKRLEDYSRSLVRRGNELYTLAGGLGSAGKIGNGKINIPASCWKIVVVLPQGDHDLQRITAQTRVISVLMPNQDTPEVSGARWAKYLTSVAALEKATGYNFLSALPDEVERALEAKTDSGRAEASDSATAPSGASGVPQPTGGVPGMIHTDIPQGAEVSAETGTTGTNSEQGQTASEDLQGGDPPSPSSPGQPSSEPYSAQEPKAAQEPSSSGQVWVNTKSGVYHLPGTRWYGNTKQGEFMSQTAADAQGYRAAGNGQ